MVLMLFLPLLCFRYSYTSEVNGLILPEEMLSLTECAKISIRDKVEVSSWTVPSGMMLKKTRVILGSDNIIEGLTFLALFDEH